MTRGRHSMKAGLNFLRQESGRDNLETPIYAYSSVADFLANVPSSARFTFGVVGVQDSRLADRRLPAG